MLSPLASGGSSEQAQSQGKGFWDPDGLQDGGNSGTVPAYICDHGPFCAACRIRLDRWLDEHPLIDIESALELDQWRAET